MAIRKENDYFTMFVEAVSYSYKAAENLHEVLLHYRPEELPGRLDAMHKIEHAADLFKHDMMSLLLKEFITPIDREDIIDLSNAIDHVTDAIEDVLLKLYMFDVPELRDDVVPFASLIMDCCSELRGLMEEFRNFRKSKTIREKVIGLNRLEEEGDQLYLRAMRRLHSSSGNVVDRLIWTELYDQIEKCCDKCEDVADVVERVVLKNS